MGSSLGSLVVSLGLNAAEFTAGLSRAEFQAKRFADNMGSSLAAAGRVAGIGLGLVATAAIAASKEIISSAAALNDFADQTGSSVESLSKLSNQAAIAGTDFGTLQGLVLKLTAGMAGADDESSNVGRALKALGVDAKDPALALQQVAVALSKYADGVGKAAIARDLFGKGGPAFLATLKDIAELGYVNATVTAKQAAEAEKLEQSLRRLVVEATAFKNIVLSGLVPALNDLITNFRLAREAGESMFGALLRSGTNLDTLPDQISRAGAEVEKIRKAVTAGANNPLRVLPGLVADKSDLDAATAKYKALIAIRDRAILSGQGDNADQISRRFLQKPTLDYTGARAAKAGGGTGRIPKDQVSEAQRYLEQLEQQLQKTQELTVVETILADIESGRLKLSNDVSTAKLLQVGALIDAAKAQEKAERELQKVRADEARTREQISAMTQRSIQALQAETTALAEQNQHIREETELIGKDATTIALLAQARLDDVINAKQQALAMAVNAGAAQAETDAMRDQIRILQERKGLLVDRGIAEKMQADMAKAKEINDQFVNSFASAASSVITNSRSISGAVKDMGRSIADTLTRIATKNIAESLFGAATSSGGGGIFSGIGSLISGLFGSGGITGFSRGTNNAPGGMAMVGERGPELVNIPRGAQVIPNHELSSRRAMRGSTINQTINVMQGASRTTADQAAMRAGINAQRALARNG